MTGMARAILTCGEQEQGHRLYYLGWANRRFMAFGIDSIRRTTTSRTLYVCFGRKSIDSEQNVVVIFLLWKISKFEIYETDQATYRC